MDDVDTEGLYRMREMLSDVLFMYRIVAVSVGVGVSFLSVVLVSR